jgi:FAD/FMN-containing dehydrogenase
MDVATDNCPRPIVNFGGNIRFTPKHCYSPATDTDVLEILDRHSRGKIRVVGARHSWSPAVVSDDALLDMRRFNSVRVEDDADGNVSAVVGGGCTIKELLRKLHRLANVTLPSLGLITEQTIAGAISTATHGSGKPSLSHYVTEVRAAAYDAETGKARIYVWNDGAELRAARCALGCMGVILSVKIRCVPRFEVAETIVPCATLAEVLAGEEQHPLQQFFLVPHRWTYFAQRRRVADGFRHQRRLSAHGYRIWWFLCIDVGLHLALKFMLFLQSPALIRFFYRHVLSKMIVSHTTVNDHSDRMLVMEHELFRHLEIEIFVAAPHLRDATAFVRAVLEVFDGSTAAPSLAAVLQPIGMYDYLVSKRGSFTHHYAIAVRRVLADDTLMSMSSGDEEAWYALSFITYAEPRDDFVGLADFLASAMAHMFAARLHWGKYFPLSNAEVENTYPRLSEFRSICAQVDPHGVFRNAFTERVLFGQQKSPRR